MEQRKYYRNGNTFGVLQIREPTGERIIVQRSVAQLLVRLSAHDFVFRYRSKQNDTIPTMWKLYHKMSNMSRWSKSITVVDNACLVRP